MENTERDFKMSFDGFIASGISASQANDSLSAIDCFQKAGAENPRSALPSFLLGAEFATLGDMIQAEAAFADAVRLAPEFSMARFQLGLLQFTSGRSAVGLLTWQPLLDLPEADPLPYFVLGFHALAQDRFEESLACYGQGLQRNTANPALSGDIEKVMARIRDVMAQRLETPSQENDDAASALDENSSAHVLLANYQQGGSTKH